jgi:hypothetical protein
MITAVILFTQRCYPWRHPVYAGQHLRQQGEACKGIVFATLLHVPYTSCSHLNYNM